MRAAEQMRQIPTLKQKITLRFREHLVSQFGQPTGCWGGIAGRIMAWRPSNRARNRWTIEVLNVRRDDRVLEIGCGPGLALRWLSELTVDGFVAGIDHAEVMVQQARRRNAKALEAGKVCVRQQAVEELVLLNLPAPFDKIMAVNVQMFWDEPVAVLKNLRRFLRPGGCIALTYQPRTADATDAAARARGAEIVAQLEQAGFTAVRTVFKAMKPVGCICTLGCRPAGEEML